MGQPQKDNITTNQLLEEIFAVKNELSDVKETLNNGIKKSTVNNTKAIENLSEEVSNMKDIIDNSKSYHKGKIATWKLIVTIVSSVGGGVVSTLIALKTLKTLGVL